MGPRAIGPSPTNGRAAAVRCRGLVGVASRGTESSGERSAIAVRVIGGGVPDHRTILEDIHRARGERCHDHRIDIAIPRETAFHLSLSMHRLDEGKELRTSGEIISAMFGENIEY